MAKNESRKCKGCDKIMENPRRNRLFHSSSCRNAYWVKKNPRIEHYQGIPESINFLNDLKELPLDAAIAGIYFLFLDNELLYIGQSSSVMSRIADHRRNNNSFDFNRAFYFKYDSNKLLERETELIALFNPPMNKKPHKRQSKKNWFVNESQNGS